MLGQGTLVHFLWSRAGREGERQRQREYKARHVAVLGVVHKKVKEHNSRKLKVNMRCIGVFHLEWNVSFRIKVISINKVLGGGNSNE